MTISVGKLRAKNLVVGTQVVGGSVDDAARLQQTAPRSAGAEINADEAEVENLVDGFQWLAGHPPTDLTELQAEVCALREQLAEIARGAADALHVDLTAAQDSLSQGEQELAQANPDGGKFLSSLKTALGRLEQVVGLGEKAGAVGTRIGTLLPVAAKLCDVAAKLLG